MRRVALLSLVLSTASRGAVFGHAGATERPAVDESLPVHPATPVEVAQAPCALATELDSSELRAWLDRSFGFQDLVSETVNGVVLENQPRALVKAFRQLTTAPGSRPASYSLQDPACRDVFCAMTEVIGDRELALRQLFMMVALGYNSSPIDKIAPRYGNDVTASFTSDQLDDAIRALVEMPKAATPPTGDGKPFKRFKQGYTLAEYSAKNFVAAANSYLMFFDPWAKHPERERRRVDIVHEVGHNIGQSKGLDFSPEWLQLSGWKELEKSKWESDRANFVSKYGSTDPQEDFAEALSAYRYSPASLRKASSAKYEFLKSKVFDGIEFENPAQCESKMGEMWTFLAKKQKQRGEREVAACLEKANVAARTIDDATADSQMSAGHWLATCRVSVLKSLIADAGPHGILDQESANCVLKEFLRSFTDASCVRHLDTLIVRMENSQKARERVARLTIGKLRSAFGRAAIGLFSGSAVPASDANASNWLHLQKELGRYAASEGTQWDYYGNFLRTKSCQHLDYDLLTFPNAFRQEFARASDGAQEPIYALYRVYDRHLNSFCAAYVDAFHEEVLDVVRRGGSLDTVPIIERAVERSIDKLVERPR